MPAPGEGVLNRTGDQFPKWPIGALKVGESLLIPWLTDAAGVRRLSQKVLHVAVWRYAKKAGIRVAREPEVWGLRVRRLA